MSAIRSKLWQYLKYTSMVVFGVVSFGLLGNVGIVNAEAEIFYQSTPSSGNWPTDSMSLFTSTESAENIVRIDVYIDESNFVSAGNSHLIIKLLGDCSVIATSLETNVLSSGWTEFYFDNGGFEIQPLTSYLLGYSLDGGNYRVRNTVGFEHEWTHWESDCSTRLQYAGFAKKVYTDAEFVAGGLAITYSQYNPATGNVFLSGTCTKYGSGTYQMDLDGTQNFNSETLRWDSIDPYRSSLVSCIDNTFTAVYNGSGLTGTTTLIIDDSFYGTELATEDFVFYEPTGFLDYNYVGENIVIDTSGVSTSSIGFTFKYDFCDDPTYSFNTVRLCTIDDTDPNSMFYNCDNYTGLATCSGVGSIVVDFPPNYNFENDVFFSYVTSDLVRLYDTDTFHLIAKPGGDSIVCTPPSFNVADVCDGIDTSWNTVGSIICGVYRGLVSAANFMFSPTCQSMSYLSGTNNKFKNTMPFSVFYGITGSITNAIEASQNATSTDDGLSIPFIQQGATSTSYFMMPVVNSQSFINFIGEDNYDTYMLTIGYIYWAVMAMIMLVIINKTW